MINRPHILTVPNWHLFVAFLLLYHNHTTMKFHSWRSITCTGQGTIALWTSGQCSQHTPPLSHTAPESLCCSFHCQHLREASSLQTTQGLRESAHWEACRVCECTEGWPCFGKKWQVDYCSLWASLCWCGEPRGRGTDGIRYVPVHPEWEVHWAPSDSLKSLSPISDLQKQF